MITSSIIHPFSTPGERDQSCLPQGAASPLQQNPPCSAHCSCRCKSHANVADNEFPHLVLCIPYTVFPCYFAVTMLTSTPQWVNMIGTPSLHESTLRCAISETTVADSRRNHNYVQCHHLWFQPHSASECSMSSCRIYAPVTVFKITKRW